MEEVGASNDQQASRSVGRENDTKVDLTDVGDAGFANLS